MRFGFWPSPWLPFSEVVELSIHAETTGWDGIWYADHFMSAGARSSGVLMSMAATKSLSMPMSASRLPADLL